MLSFRYENPINISYWWKIKLLASIEYTWSIEILQLYSITKSKKDTHAFGAFIYFHLPKFYSWEAKCFPTSLVLEYFKYSLNNIVDFHFNFIFFYLFSVNILWNICLKKNIIFYIYISKQYFSEIYKLNGILESLLLL